VVVGTAVRPATVKPGQRTILYFQVRIARTWHIYGEKSSGEAIPTTLKLLPHKGIEPIGSWQYPPGKTNADGSAPHYEDAVTFQQQLRVRAGTAPGPLEVKCEIGYQACDPFHCLPPTRKEIKVVVVVTGNNETS
jgi:DsbC/DsbD-like thiol-disulfide interchange protein